MRDMKVCLSLYPSRALSLTKTSTDFVPDPPLPTYIFQAFFVANGPGTPVSEMLRTLKPCQHRIGK